MSDPNKQPDDPKDIPPGGPKGVALMILAIVLAAALAWLAVSFFHRPANGGTSAIPAAADDDEPLFAAPAFEMTAQTGQTVKSSDLAGRVWIANFIFTNCAGPCPRMTETMAGLTQQIGPTNTGGGSDVRFVSFSVDPKRDTPKVLADYARRHGSADQSRWMLLTEPGTNYMDVAHGFKVIAEPAKGDQPIIHAEAFFLVDKNGQVRGTYKWNDPESIAQLVADAKKLSS